MGTSQLLDLFSVSDDTSSKNDQADEDKPSSLKDVLGNMEKLWDEKSQYEDLNLDAFLQSMQ